MTLSKVDKAIDHLTYQQAVYQLLRSLERLASTLPDERARLVVANMLAETEMKLRVTK